jgi:hypothetical protein
MSITSLFSSSGFFSVNKVLTVALDSMECAGFFATLCSKSDYWQSRGELDNGYFYCTQDSIHAETRINPKRQRVYCKKLEEAGLITTKTKGLPKRKFYRINTKKALQLIENTGKAQIVLTGKVESAQLYSPNRPINKIRKTRSDKQDEEHYTITEAAIGVRLFADQLDADKYPACREAISVLKAMKRLGASNLYDGPLTVEEWDKAEAGLQGVIDRGENLQDIMIAAYNDRFRTPTYSQPDSVNLCYFVHGYDESNDGNRLLHMAAAY